MPPKKTSPEEKLRIKRLKELRYSINRVKSLLSFHSIRTLNDVLRELGIDEIRYQQIFPGEAYFLDEQITFPRVSELCNRLLKSEETSTEVAAPITPTKPEIETLPISAIHNLVKPLLPKRHPKQTATCLYFQQNWAEETFYKIVKEQVRGHLLRANTGDGKTYALGQLIRWLFDCGWIEQHTNSPYPFIYITKATIVEQTRRDLYYGFGFDCVNDVWVTHYDNLRSSGGEILVDYVEKVEYGEMVGHWKWRPFIHPLVMVCDECHSLKNPDSQQSKIIQAFNQIPHNFTTAIHSSATPFSRVSGAQCFAVSTRHKFSFGFHQERELTNDNWPMFCKMLVDDPYEYSKANIKRFLKEFKLYVNGFRNVRRKFKSINRVEFIDFESKEDAAIYASCWEEYLKRRGEIEGRAYANSYFLILAQLTIFRAKAELLRAPIIARKMFQAWQAGYAPICATNFIATIARAVNILYQDYNIPRSLISLIWGGSSAFAGAQKYSKDQIKDILKKAMLGIEDVSAKTLREITKQLEFEASGLADLPPELDLGTQSRQQRQDNIDRFQSGKSQFCFFTFKAGGAGLSLHHNTEGHRPRKGLHSPTWNEMESLQALGRGHRITSLSDTEQSVLAFRGTIEPQVLSRMNGKARCMEEVILHSETQVNFKNEDIAKLIDIVDKRSREDNDNDENDDIVTEKDYQDIEDERENK